MKYDVDKYDDGYLLTLHPQQVGEETSLRGLSAEDVNRRLRELDAHPRDVIEAIWDADRRFERGTTDRVREVREIWRRAEQGVSTNDDVDVLRRELSAATLDVRKTYLINALYMAGCKEEALESLINILDLSEEGDDVELGLRFLSEWSPETFEHVAVRFIRGVPWDKMRVRMRAMTYAGGLLDRGLAPSLLDELVRIATDEGEGASARKDARFALAAAAGLSMLAPETERIGFGGTEADIARVIDQARRRLLPNDG